MYFCQGRSFSFDGFCFLSTLSLFSIMRFWRGLSCCHGHSITENVRAFKLCQSSLSLLFPHFEELFFSIIMSVFIALSCRTISPELLKKKLNSIINDTKKQRYILCLSSLLSLKSLFQNYLKTELMSSGHSLALLVAIKECLNYKFEYCLKLCRGLVQLTSYKKEQLKQF